MASLEHATVGDILSREAGTSGGIEATGRRTAANQAVFFFTLLLVALAPIPIGSNRPFFWMINGVLVGGATLLYCVALGFDPGRLRIPIRTVGIPAMLFGISIAWVILQVVPLPARLPFLADVTSAWVDASAALDRSLASRISLDPAATLGMAVRLATYALLFFLVLQAAAAPHRARSLIAGLFWVTVLHAGAAILMLHLGDRLFVFPKWAYRGYATGFFVNRNSFATFAAIGMALGTALILDLMQKRSGRSGGLVSGGIEFLQTAGVYLAGVAILATAIVLSASRMGAVAAMGGVVVPFAAGFIRPNARHRLWPIATTLLVLAVFTIAMSGGGLTDRIGSLENSADDRLILYKQVLSMISARPWTGYGGGTFAQAFPMFHELPLSADVTWDSAHNLYLELFADLGIVALAQLLACGWLLALQIRAIRTSRAQWLAPAAATAATAVAAIHSLADFSMQIEANALLYVAILAAGSAQSLLVSWHPKTQPHAPPRAGGFAV